MSYLPEIALMRGFRWVWYWNFSPSSLGEKKFLMGLFSPTRAFSGGFWQISLKRSLYVKNWRKRTAFFFDFGSRWVLPKFSGAPWDPLRRRNWSQSSTEKLLKPLLEGCKKCQNYLNVSSGSVFKPFYSGDNHNWKLYAHTYINSLARGKSKATWSALSSSEGGGCGVGGGGGGCCRRLPVEEEPGWVDAKSHLDI